MPELSEETKLLISYWLRGAIKGYGVRLDDLDGFGFSDKNIETIARELHALSDGSVNLDTLLYSGLGLSKS